MQGYNKDIDAEVYLTSRDQQWTHWQYRGVGECWGFLNCAGAIDGSHIPISSPVTCILRTEYYNQKGFFQEENTCTWVYVSFKMCKFLVNLQAKNLASFLNQCFYKMKILQVSYVSQLARWNSCKIITQPNSCITCLAIPLHNQYKQVMLQDK